MLRAIHVNKEVDRELEGQTLIAECALWREHHALIHRRDSIMRYLSRHNHSFTVEVAHVRIKHLHLKRVAIRGLYRCGRVGETTIVPESMIRQLFPRWLWWPRGVTAVWWCCCQGDRRKTTVVDQRVRWSLVPSSVILAEDICILINEELLREVLVWLLLVEHGHGAHTAAGGGQTGLKIP